jgi:hypothetical protein
VKEPLDKVTSIMKLKNFTLTILLVAAGCVTSSHKATGELHPPVTADNVKVYTTLPSQYEVVGHVAADSFAGVDLQQATGDAIFKLKAQAGKMGANGIIINGLQDKPLGGAQLTAEAIFVKP